jgi:hypothetical protein
MSHDKIKAAARRRMARTGESYQTARLEVIKAYKAARRRDQLSEAIGPNVFSQVIGARMISEPFRQAMEAHARMMSEPLRQAMEANARMMSEPLRQAMEAHARMMSEPLRQAMEAHARMISEPLRRAAEANARAMSQLSARSAILGQFDD